MKPRKLGLDDVAVCGFSVWLGIVVAFWSSHQFDLMTAQRASDLFYGGMVGILAYLAALVTTAHAQ